MSAGRAIARKYNKKGSQVGDLLYPVRGIRDQQARRGKAPVNHARENIRAMRQTQAKNRALSNAQNQKKEEKFVMKRFQGVQSRWVKPDVKERDRVREEYIQKRAVEIDADRSRKETARREMATARRSEIENRLPAPSVAAPDSPPRPEEARITKTRRSTPSKPRVPSHKDVAKLAPRSKKDFVKSNLISAVTSSPPKAQEEDVTRRQVHEDFGTVPTYIQQRKAEAAEKSRLAEEKAEREKGCPPGMTRMSEEERLETLEVLKKNKKVGYEELQKLPMTVETPSLIKRKSALESKLQQIEEALKIFSREVVWVQEDAWKGEERLKKNIKKNSTVYNSK